MIGKYHALYNESQIKLKASEELRKAESMTARNQVAEIKNRAAETELRLRNQIQQLEAKVAELEGYQKQLVEQVFDMARRVRIQNVLPEPVPTSSQLVTQEERDVLFGNTPIPKEGNE